MASKTPRGHEDFDKPENIVEILQTKSDVVPSGGIGSHLYPA